MAKMTEAQLKSFVASYVTAAKQAGTWTASTDNLYTLQDKIGKQVQLDGLFVDKMPEMDGDNLPLGKTIEEFYADLILPEAYSETADPNSKHLITTESPSYSFTLGRKVLKTTVPFDNVERAAIDTEAASTMLTTITKRLFDSEAMYKYAQKRQLLGNLIAKAEAASNSSKLVKVLAAPSNESTSKAFIKDVKETVEVASDFNEGHNLANCVIGAAPSLTLYVKQGVIPTLEVEALAAAFNKGELAIPAKIKVVKDFGNDQTDTYAVLVDDRTCRLHNGYRAVRTNENGDADFINYFLHSENTAFISKFTFVKVYKSA